MSDFTKGELGEIKSCVYFEGWKSDGSENANQHLLDKIQSMIDNYCDHRLQKPIYIVTGYDGSDVHIEKCFSSLQGAEKFKEEIYLKCNEGHENEEYSFSIQERMLING